MLVAQSCLTLCSPMDCSPPGFSVGFSSKNTGVDCHSLLQRTFLTQGSNPGLLHCRQVLYCLSYREVSKETIIERDTRTSGLTEALFTVARTWKQPRYPSTDEWVESLRYIHAEECCSSIKRNAVESVLVKWMNLEPIIQSEVSHKGKNKYHMLMHIYGI